MTFPQLAWAPTLLPAIDTRASPRYETQGRTKTSALGYVVALVAGLAHGTAAASVAASVARERGAAALVIAPPSAAGVAASNLCTARAVLDELGRPNTIF